MRGVRFVVVLLALAAAAFGQTGPGIAELSPWEWTMGHSVTITMTGTNLATAEVFFYYENSTSATPLEAAWDGAKLRATIPDTVLTQAGLAWIVVMGAESGDIVPFVVRPNLGVSNPVLANGRVGNAYAQLIDTWGTGTGDRTFVADSGPFPPGVSLTADGWLQGTPTTAGTYTFDVTITDAVETITATIEVTVDQGLAITNGSLPDAEIGKPYSVMLHTNAPETAYAWSFVSGQLPPGITLDSETGVVSGIPATTGTYNFRVSAREIYSSTPLTVEKALSIVVGQGALGITTTALPDGVLDKAYNATLLAAGGSSPYTWTQTGGTLPPGLVLSSSGAISGTPPTTGSYEVAVQVTDQQAVSASGTVTLQIRETSLTLMAPPMLRAGSVNALYYYTIGASGGTPPYTWSLAGLLPEGLTLDTSTGEIKGTPAREGTISFWITLHDQTAYEVVRKLSIKIGPAILAVATKQCPDGMKTAAYSYRLSGVNGQPPYTWSIVKGQLPSGLTLDPDTGEITGTPDREGISYFWVQLSDPKTASAPAGLSIAITPPQLRVNTDPVPVNGLVNTPYSFTLTGSMGTPPYRWRMVSGSLPPGLTLDSSGEISGVPTRVGGWRFGLWVVDAEGFVGTGELTIYIDFTRLSIATATLPSGTEGAAYSHFLSGDGGVPPYQWEVIAGSLPPGLTLSKFDGTITGTPTAHGTARFTVEMRDFDSRLSARSFVLSIAPPVAVATTVLPPATAGTAYSQILGASGGVGQNIWTLVSGPLPAGLALDPGTGKLTGVPTDEGTASFIVSVTDAAGSTNTAGLSLVVKPGPLGVGPVTPALGVAGTAYLLSLPATGGARPYTWAIAAGSLPAGLALDSATGTISGTPATPGTASFTATVTDSAHTSASASLTIAVRPAPVVVTTTSLPAGTAGTAYSFSLTATGGVPAYTWQVRSGAVPEGLSVSAGGVISGMPAGPGKSTFTLEVRDSAGSTATQEMGLVIDGVRTLGLGAGALKDGTVGSAYSDTIAPSGGTAPFTFSIAGGELPAGLSLDTRTGAITGTPTLAGASNFVVNVTDSSPGGPVSAAQSCSIKVNLPAVTGLTITGLADVMNAARQPVFAVALANAYPLPLTGTLTLSFVPDPGLPEDPAVAFVSGGRTLEFAVPSGELNAVFAVKNAGLQTGTVAGAITLEARLQAGGSDVTPAPALTRTVRVGPSAPGIGTITTTRVEGGLEVEIFGYSTTREISQAKFRLSAAAGSALHGTEFTVEVGDAFTTWFKDPASEQYGSSFRFVWPLSIQGDTSAITGVEVLLSNSSGWSQAVRASL